MYNTFNNNFSNFNNPFQFNTNDSQSTELIKNEQIRSEFEAKKAINPNNPLESKLDNIGVYMAANTGFFDKFKNIMSHFIYFKFCNNVTTFTIVDTIPLRGVSY